MIVVWESDISGPVQTSCYCRAELNSGIKFDKSTAEARRLNQTFSDTFLIPRLNYPIKVTLFTSWGKLFHKQAPL